MRLFIVSLFIVATAAAASVTQGCGPNSPGPVVANNVIDCTASNAGSVATLLADFRAKISGGSSWAVIEADAKAAGTAIGGCALAEARPGVPRRQGRAGDRRQPRGARCARGLPGDGGERRELQDGQRQPLIPRSRQSRRSRKPLTAA